MKFAQQEIAASQIMPDAVSGAVENPTAQIDLQEQQKLEALAKYQALDVQNAQLYEDAKTAIQRQAANARQQIAQNEANMQSQAISSIIGSVSQGFDGLANLAAGAAGKSSGAYQSMFALSKGFAVAQAALNLQLAISQAMADPTALTPAQKFANYAAIASAGASLLTSIGSISMGGAREHGGPVNVSSMYRVGESGKPEIFKASNGSQYMIPGDNGSVNGQIFINDAFINYASITLAKVGSWYSSNYVAGQAGTIMRSDGSFELNACCTCCFRPKLIYHCRDVNLSPESLYIFISDTIYIINSEVFIVYSINFNVIKNSRVIP
ncbi:hypothetical protein [Pantoea sp. S62]|uniref:phage tail tip fiber protein n=1 Tax=Pantoea sp. S62 TaxID=2769342 RepID=UPI0019138066|nr:hypothetical protein [Pantoea sp. S62]MBK5014428.1 tape measure protein [Pantoea sp. S62]